MSVILPAFIFFLLLLSFCTHIFSFPANWLIILILTLWSWFTPDASFTLSSFLVFTVAALAGEVVEFLLQIVGARRYGASSSGNWGAFVGAIAGAILGVPFLLGMGALIGAVVGAYAGCLGAELVLGRSIAQARSAALGAMIGKVLGVAIKMGIGVAFLVHAFDMLF